MLQVFVAISQKIIAEKGHELCKSYLLKKEKKKNRELEKMDKCLSY
jgi:hypothetical protein